MAGQRDARKHPFSMVRARKPGDMLELVIDPGVLMRTIVLGDLLRSALIATGVFAFLGTIAALWPNPMFMRMSPAGSVEILALAAQAALAGLYLGVARSPCASSTAGIGGVLGFLGIACPVCNKLLVWAFGATLLMEYFEPVRIYVALAGVALLALALWKKLHAGAGACRAMPEAGAS